MVADHIKQAVVPICRWCYDTGADHDAVPICDDCLDRHQIPARMVDFGGEGASEYV